MINPAVKMAPTECGRDKKHTIPTEFKESKKKHTTVFLSKFVVIQNSYVG